MLGKLDKDKKLVGSGLSLVDSRKTEKNHGSTEEGLKCRPKGGWRSKNNIIKRYEELSPKALIYKKIKINIIYITGLQS